MMKKTLYVSTLLANVVTIVTGVVFTSYCVTYLISNANFNTLITDSLHILFFVPEQIELFRSTVGVRIMVVLAFFLTSSLVNLMLTRVIKKQKNAPKANS